MMKVPRDTSMMKVTVLFIVILFSVVYSEELLSTSVVAIPDNGGECLSAHNTLRALHKNTSALVWDSHLAREAQKWANHLASIHHMVHSHGKQRPKNQGENLAYFRQAYYSHVVPTCKHAVERWYIEINNYDFWTGRSKRPGKHVGHFTQLVWRNTKKVGMGIATSIGYGYKYTLFVARYSPPGNVGGWYLENVEELKHKLNPCDSKPCGIGGRCISFVTSYICHCRAMYFGSHCQHRRACRETWRMCKHFPYRICQIKHYIPHCLITCDKCTPICQDTYHSCKKYRHMLCYSYAYYSYRARCRKTCGKCSKHRHHHHHRS